MLNFFTPYLPKQQKYRCLALSLFVALVLLGITNHINTKNSQEIAEDTADTYGNTLAKLVSEQVATSALNKDSISLQATASYISSQTTVAAIMIYDINHNIMAQSSDDSTIKQGQEKHYTSPIISGDNIIGSITLSIFPQQDIHSGKGIYIAAALILLFI